MSTYTFRTLLGSILLLSLSAFQAKSKLALDRPYTNIFANADTFTRDMADIKREHSLSEMQWKHLRFYHDFSASNRAQYPSTGLTYRQANQLLEKYEFSKEAQKRIRRETKELEAPPLILK